MKVTITALTGTLSREFTIAVGDNIFIGRGSGAQWQIQDDKISGVHCRLVFNKMRIQIIDSQSKNGTYINGIRIQESEVFVGDIIKVGNTFLHFEASKMDQDALDVLTFPGRTARACSDEVKAEFRNAQIESQSHMKEKQMGFIELLHPSHEKEFEIRKQAKTHIVLYNK